jgi:hypothetical protein
MLQGATSTDDVSIKCTPTSSAWLARMCRRSVWAATSVNKTTTSHDAEFLAPGESLAWPTDPVIQARPGWSNPRCRGMAEPTAQELRPDMARSICQSSPDDH